MLMVLADYKQLIRIKIYFITNVFKEENISDYGAKYQSIKNTFAELQYFGNIKLPENFHKTKSKNKVRSNVSKSKFKKKVLKAKRIDFPRVFMNHLKWIIK